MASRPRPRPKLSSTQTASTAELSTQNSSVFAPFSNIFNYLQHFFRDTECSDVFEQPTIKDGVIKLVRNPAVFSLAFHLLFSLHRKTVETFHHSFPFSQESIKESSVFVRSAINCLLCCICSILIALAVSSEFSGASDETWIQFVTFCSTCFFIYTYANSVPSYNLSKLGVGYFTFSQAMILLLSLLHLILGQSRAFPFLYGMLCVFRVMCYLIVVRHIEKHALAVEFPSTYKQWHSLGSDLQFSLPLFHRVLIFEMCAILCPAFEYDYMFTVFVSFTCYLYIFNTWRMYLPSVWHLSFDEHVYPLHYKNDEAKINVHVRYIHFTYQKYLVNMPTFSTFVFQSVWQMLVFVLSYVCFVHYTPLPLVEYRQWMDWMPVVLAFYLSCLLTFQGIMFTRRIAHGYNGLWCVTAFPLMVHFCLVSVFFSLEETHLSTHTSYVLSHPLFHVCICSWLSFITNMVYPVFCMSSSMINSSRLIEADRKKQTHEEEEEKEKEKEKERDHKPTKTTSTNETQTDKDESKQMSKMYTTVLLKVSTWYTIVVLLFPFLEVLVHTWEPRISVSSYTRMILSLIVLYPLNTIYSSSSFSSSSDTVR